MAQRRGLHRTTKTLRLDYMGLKSNRLGRLPLTRDAGGFRTVCQWAIERALRMYPR